MSSIWKSSIQTPRVSSSMIIVLGCGNEKELIGRLDKCIECYKQIAYVKLGYTSNTFIMCTGTEKECLFMCKYIIDVGMIGETRIFSENESRNTIDNIINTFYYMCGADTLHGNRDVIHITQSWMGDPIDVEYSIDKYIIISSMYHIPRVKFIMNECGIFDGSIPRLNCKSKKFEYIGSLSFDESRYKTEEKIEKNKTEYQKYIRASLSLKKII